MIKETSPGLVEPQKTQSPHADPASIRPFNRESLIDAIEAERQRIFRARSIAQTAAKLLHELYVNERNEPDVGFVLDVVSDLLEDSLAGLDRVTQESLWEGWSATAQVAVWHRCELLRFAPPALEVAGNFRPCTLFGDVHVTCTSVLCGHG